MVTSLLNSPIIGGLTVGGFLVALNILVVRYLLQYNRETREEYARRLTRAIIELEAQKTINAKMECEVRRLRNLVKRRGRGCS